MKRFVEGLNRGQTVCRISNCPNLPLRSLMSDAEVRTVEVVHDCFARQAIDTAPLENVANVAEQDNGGIFILVLAGKNDRSLSRPRCPIRPNASAMAMRGRQLSAWRSRNRAGIGGSELSSASFAHLKIMR